MILLRSITEDGQCEIGGVYWCTPQAGSGTCAQVSIFAAHKGVQVSTQVTFWRLAQPLASSCVPPAWLVVTYTLVHRRITWQDLYTHITHDNLQTNMSSLCRSFRGADLCEAKERQQVSFKVVTYLCLQFPECDKAVSLLYSASHAKTLKLAFGTPGWQLPLLSISLHFAFAWSAQQLKSRTNAYSDIYKDCNCYCCCVTSLCELS